MPFPCRPTQSPGAGEGSRTHDDLLLNPFPCRATTQKLHRDLHHEVFLRHSAKDKAVARPPRSPPRPGRELTERQISCLKPLNRREGTSNIQHPTSNLCAIIGCWAFDVGCWMF